MDRSILAENPWRKPGQRRFDIRIAGTDVQPGHEPIPAGFALADPRTFEAEVRERTLDIEFIRKADAQLTFGMAVERIR